jgi:hypothetical protein
LFDLTTFSISLESGQEQYDLPGLLVSAAPRRAARLRAQDQLLLYCRLVDASTGAMRDATLPQAKQTELLNRLVDAYFTFSGSVTAGLRELAAKLNEFLLNRNLHAGQEGQILGLLNAAALHGNTMILAHGGATHTFLISGSQVQHFEDTALTTSGRALGISRQPVLRFYQSSIAPGDLLTFCARPPAAWAENQLASIAQANFDTLHRRVTSNGGASLQSVFVRFQDGKGQVEAWRPGGVRAAAVRTAASDRAASSARTARPSAGFSSMAARPTSTPAPETDQPSAAPLSETAPSGAKTADEEQALPSRPRARQNRDVVEADFTTFGSAEETAAPSPGPTGLPGPEALMPPAQPAPGAELRSAAPQQTEPPETSGPDAADPDHARPAAEMQPAQAAPTETIEPQPRWDSSDGLPDLETLMAPHPAESSPQTPFPASGVYLSSADRPAQEAPTPRPTRLNSMARPAAAPAGNSAAGQPRRTTTTTNAAADAAASATASAAASAAAKRTNAKSASAAVESQPLFEGLRVGLAGIWRKGRRTRRNVDSFFARATDALPRRQDAQGQAVPFYSLSSGAMLGIAFIVPLIVVAVAMTVYIRAGRSEQFRALLLQAQQMSAQAAQQTDPLTQRNTWQHVYELVNTAEIYGSSDAAVQLKQQAIRAIDSIEGYVRLDYQPVAGNVFAADLKFTRVAASLNDLYLLDGNKGSVTRLFRTSSGYEIDAKFVCGAGMAGTISVGPLIDIMPLAPTNDLKSTVMGIDANGNLEYCTPGQPAFETRSLARPDAGWQKISAVAMNGDTLYVLDAPANAIYRYDGSGGIFDQPPHFYFDTAIPKLDDLVDMTADQEFLYLLHSTGQMTVCSSGGFAYAATKCTDPMPYGDSRPGFDPAPLSFTGSNLIQVETTQPPDPSLFALDAANRSVYHLSLRRMNLQRQYLSLADSDYPLPKTAPTAFTVAPNRRVIIAFGNQVFYAPLP